MTPRVTIMYPYFQPSNDYSIFRFPPLGLAYIAAYLKEHHVPVDLVDCTFMEKEEAVKRVCRSQPEIIGIYSMYSMRRETIEMARELRKEGTLLVAGGPLPTIAPKEFLQDFDVVVIGEGELTMLDLVREIEGGSDFSKVKGIAFKHDGGRVIQTSPREFVEDLNSLPFPAREFFDHKAYQSYFLKTFGYKITSMITSRGCPFKCHFCSRPVFGNRLRARSATNVVNELQTIEGTGYDRVWFADDCFTLNRRRLFDICKEITQRGIKLKWECLSRVDTVDAQLLDRMKEAGCLRLFFGIESGNDSVLKMMGKQASANQARRAVEMTHRSGIKTGAFFIVGYPGETNNTILDTVNFASTLPLDYIGFTMPYPIPDTPLYETVKKVMIAKEYEEPRGRRLIKHQLLFRSQFSETKLRFAILKASVQFKLSKKLGAHMYRFVGRPFEHLTNILFRVMR